MSAFDFSTAEAWETSTDTLLPLGNHRVQIKDPTMAEASTGKPQIELRVENTQGSLRDWLVITPKTIGKIAQLYDAAKVERPKADEVDQSTGRIADRAVDRLANQWVGVIVREEPDNRDVTKMRKRIAGYVDVDQIDADAPAETDALPTAAATASGSSPAASEDDRIPF